ncbi:hypothetical protein LV35_04272 [Acinetobacter baumannii]|uniref:Uncharacterized protein n=1 Tax=Acinetobacter baumannii TaxID=470 RepID=A0AAJ0VMG6_ACIBA|nr:hypothetical protein LV35_04272 [Acinetobacter baumannii]
MLTRTAVHPRAGSFPGSRVGHSGADTATARANELVGNADSPIGEVGADDGGRNGDGGHFGILSQKIWTRYLVMP